jgi:hypothetical protein
MKINAERKQFGKIDGGKKEGKGDATVRQTMLKTILIIDSN